MKSKFGYLVDLIIGLIIVWLVGAGFFNTEELMTRLVILPFWVVMIIYALNNLLMLLNIYTLANHINKMYTLSFLIFMVVFLGYWSYLNIKSGNYFSLIFLIPFIYFIWLIWKKNRKNL